MDDELEAAITALIVCKYAAPEGSAERKMVIRQLAGLRFTREHAGPIMEKLDPWGWDAASPLPKFESEGPVIPLRRKRQEKRT